MAITKVFQSGNSRAIRIPREFQVPLGQEFEILRADDGLLLRKVEPKGLSGALKLFASLPDDMGERKVLPQQDKEGL